MKRKHAQIVEPKGKNLDPDETYLQLKFLEYHEARPEVYGYLRDFMFQAKKSGRKTYPINGLFERVRWHMDVETKDGDGYKMNNNYRSRYARMLMRDYPEFAGFFEIRVLKA